MIVCTGIKILTQKQKDLDMARKVDTPRSISLPLLDAKDMEKEW